MKTACDAPEPRHPVLYVPWCVDIPEVCFGVVARSDLRLGHTLMSAGDNPCEGDS